MKKTVIAATVLCLTAGTPIYSFAADPCEVVLCMYGKATGNSGGSECSSAERAFFK
ncbi:TPA: conjugal transfer protein, partial [Klebsiella pneumoniae]|nr:conjugal transfer protein [Klebsiella pneumoniae]